MGFTVVTSTELRSGYRQTLTLDDPRRVLVSVQSSHDS